MEIIKKFKIVRQSIFRKALTVRLYVHKEERLLQPPRFSYNSLSD